MKRFSASRETPVSVREVEEAVESLCRAKVLLPLNGKLLALGVSVTGRPTVDSS
jgi:hypothetical protein